MPKQTGVEGVEWGRLGGDEGGDMRYRRRYEEIKGEIRGRSHLKDVRLSDKERRPCPPPLPRHARRPGGNVEETRVILACHVYHQGR